MEGASEGRQCTCLAFVLQALVLVLVPVASVALLGGSSARSDDGGPVYVVEISGTIDLGLAPYLDRVLGDAERAGADAVVVEINTPGGRLDAVIQMRGALIDSPLRTIALVDSTAFSAGALVAIACKEIYMTPGAVMGAATPVLGSTGEVADEKTISAVRATFESTAEERGRDPRIAGAMVDPTVEIDGLIERGRLLTLTVSQAVEVGYANGVVADRTALLSELGMADRRVVETSPSLAEQLVRIITNPVVASLLLIIGMFVIIADLASGGIGVGLIAGLGLLALFFWGHMLAGLAGWEDVALVALGVALIAVEVFVVPGFGVPGVLGLVALLGGAFLAMLYRDFDFVTYRDLVRAAVTVSVTFIGIVGGLIVVLAFLSRKGPPRGLVLHARLGVRAPVTERAQGGWLRWFDVAARLPADRVEAADEVADDVADTEHAARTESGGVVPDAAARRRSLVGSTGIALSDLRPSGIADIDGQRVDVVTSGEYIRSGERIEVILDERYRRVVRRRAA